MSWCRSTPSPEWDWERVKTFCRAFAELMVAEEPDRYVAHVKIADRHGRILIDWLRNAIGNTAIGSFCPRARPGAMVATPLAWDEVNPKLDPARFTLRTVPERLARLQQDPWRDFFDVDQRLPDLVPAPKREAARKPALPASDFSAARPHRRRPQAAQAITQKHRMCNDFSSRPA